MNQRHPSARAGFCQNARSDGIQLSCGSLLALCRIDPYESRRINHPIDASKV